MSTFLSPADQESQWQAALASANDAELLERINREAGLRAWSSARARYLSLLQKEIRNRDWDSSLLFGQEATMGLPVFHLHQKVALVDHILVPKM
jgi:hypothetical protein